MCGIKKRLKIRLNIYEIRYNVIINGTKTAPPSPGRYPEKPKGTDQMNPSENHKKLAARYGVPLAEVEALAATLGPKEELDALPLYVELLAGLVIS